MHTSGHLNHPYHQQVGVITAILQTSLSQLYLGLLQAYSILLSN